MKYCYGNIRKILVKQMDYKMADSVDLCFYASLILKLINF